MFCKDCGTQLPDGSRFCGSCGSEQTTPQPVKKPAGKKKKVSKALVIGICALLVVAILGAVVIPMLFPKTETIYVMVSQIHYNRDETPYTQTVWEYDENGFWEEETTVSSDGSKACISYTCDEHGNIIKAEYPDGSWDEFEYEARKVTLQQADYFRRRNGVLTETDLDEYRLFQDTPLYYLIPNPLWETDR